MLLTKEVFDYVKPGETIRTVTTKFQTLHDPGEANLKFVAVKGDSGTDWAIYGHRAHNTDNFVARQGDKVTGKDLIQSLCPCTEEVLNLYRF